MKGNIRQAYIGDLLASLRAAIGCKACTNKYKHANVSVRGRGEGWILGMVISRIIWDYISYTFCLDGCSTCSLHMIVEGSKQERFQVSSASEQCHSA